MRRPSSRQTVSGTRQRSSRSPNGRARSATGSGGTGWRQGRGSPGQPPVAGTTPTQPRRSSGLPASAAWGPTWHRWADAPRRWFTVRHRWRAQPTRFLARLRLKVLAAASYWKHRVPLHGPGNRGDPWRRALPAGPQGSLNKGRLGHVQLCRFPTGKEVPTRNRVPGNCTIPHLLPHGPSWGRRVWHGPRLRPCSHLNSHRETALRADGDKPQGTLLPGPAGRA